MTRGVGSGMHCTHGWRLTFEIADLKSTKGRPRFSKFWIDAMDVVRPRKGMLGKTTSAEH